MVAGGEEKVQLIAEGDRDGVGAVRRFTWGTALPYTLSFDMTATRVEPMHILEGRAKGELDGAGLWTLTREGEGTHVRYDWQIDVTKPWQVALAPVLRPIFAWNHNVVMGWGYEDLKTRLKKTAPPRRCKTWPIRLPRSPTSLPSFPRAMRRPSTRSGSTMRN